MPQQCHSLPVNQAREALGWNSPKKTLNQTRQTSLGRSRQGDWCWTRWWGGLGDSFILRWGNPFQTGGRPWGFQWESCGWQTRPHTLRWHRTPAGRYLVVWVVKLGGLAHSTISYGTQWVRQDHADLNTLRASRTHQENTLSYSRRQEMDLAAVEQYSIKQTSVSFQSHTYISGSGGYMISGPRHPQAAGIPQDAVASL